MNDDRDDPISIQSSERWREIVIRAKPSWSLCAILALILMVFALVGDLVLLSVSLIFHSYADSRWYSLLIGWKLFLSPLQYGLALILGCFGAAHCRAEVQTRGAGLAVISVITAYWSLVVWYSVFASVYLTNEWQLHGVAVLAAVGLAWSLSDRSAVARWGLLGVLAVLVAWPVFPMLVDQRETGRRQQLKYNLMWRIMKGEFQQPDNFPRAVDSGTK